MKTKLSHTLRYVFMFSACHKPIIQHIFKSSHNREDGLREMLGKLLSRAERPQMDLASRVLWPLRVESSVNADEVRSARDDLRRNGVELDVLSNAIRLIYEAEADRRISRGERDRLALRYRRRMMEIRDAVSRSESVVALHQLEQAQRELAHLFNRHFGELNEKVGELRKQLGLATPKKPASPSKARISQPKPPEKEKSEERIKKGRREQKPTLKNEAEERIERIRTQIEEALGRLSNIEIEA